jgi:hypothetical protein
MPHPLSPLADPPAGYAEAAGLIDGLDRCLLVGFSRLGPDQQTALANLTRAFVGTPLAESLAAAVDAVGRGEFRENHFAVLAAARAALQGAQYDALRKQVSAALGRPFDPAAEDAEPPKVEGPFATWGESTRHWLTELALAGFKQLEASAVLPFSATLENIEAEPRAVRQAALLAGFQQELLHSVPVSALPEVPVHRWADLWTRGMIGSFRMPTPPTGAKVTGTFFPLGTEHRSHASFAAYVVFGVLETKDGPPRVVRVNLTTYKVDALRGREVWRSFPAECKPLLKALSEGGSLGVTGCTLLPTGDLLCDGKTADGSKADPFAKAAERLNAAVALAPAAAADRHPVQIAEPVYLDGFKVNDNAVSLSDGPALPLLPAAFPSWGEVLPGELSAAEKMVALLRFDAGLWHVQPLAVQTGGKKPARVISGGGALEALAPKKKGDTLAILKERASRLLRAKK